MKVTVEAAKSNSFFRCGIEFTRKPKKLEVGVGADITKEQLDILNKEPMLVVRMPEVEQNKLKEELRKEIKEELRKEILDEMKEVQKDNNKEDSEKDKSKRQRRVKKDE